MNPSEPNEKIAKPTACSPIVSDSIVTDFMGTDLTATDLTASDSIGGPEPKASDIGEQTVGSEQTRSSASAPQPMLTDAEAEKRLPGYALAFEDYHLHRAQGASPSEALQRTLAEWRAFWGEMAYVPHRRRS